jgi:hypothetical protein
MIVAVPSAERGTGLRKPDRANRACLFVRYRSLRILICKLCKKPGAPSEKMQLLAAELLASNAWAPFSCWRIEPLHGIDGGRAILIKSNRDLLQPEDGLPTSPFF